MALLFTLLYMVFKKCHHPVLMVRTERETQQHGWHDQRKHPLEGLISWRTVARLVC